MTPRTLLHLGESAMTPRTLLHLGESAMTPRTLLHLGESAMTPRILLHLGGSAMTPRTLLHLGGSAMTPQTLLYLGGSAMTPRTLLHLGGSAMSPRILLCLGEPIMIHRIPLCSGSIIVLQVCLLEGPVMTHQIHLLLGGPITVPQLFLLRERPVAAPLTPLNLEGLWNPWTHQSSGGPVMTPLIRLLMFLIHCTEPKAVKPQKEPLAKLLHIGRGQDPLSPQSRRAASMNVTRTSLRHEKGSSPSRRKFHTSLSPRRHQSHTLGSSSYPGDSQKASDSDLSPPRKKPSSRPQGSDSDLSPPRNRPGRHSSDSDLSPPRRKQRAKSSDSDLSPPRRTQPLGKKAAHMYSGAKTGLVLTDIQREQQELQERDQEAMAFEAEFQYAETVFRDKSGRKRNLKLERLEQRRRAEKDSKRDELYAQWGKGLVQSRQQQQNVEDAIKEMQKPLARYIDDEDLDRMLREQEREGDPMANFIKKNKAKENKDKKVRPRYSGPAPPPNRFNIWPGYRWDGVDRSNGFEQKRFARLASKKAVEELAYKWSVEDM
ncbi:BUD13 homolog isoform X8 [Myotis myotis]|uniref:BUD13 homolog isoform X8 n=1 Tax=Myotis myotis TaxID=51298 RepID=UPI00174A4C6B|nr:BUD13 homolog isoform X8 [Myotis myotis]XP_036180149.1 BUD13 homolog isoform X8 [Myotis myotis]